MAASPTDIAFDVAGARFPPPGDRRPKLFGWSDVAGAKGTVIVFICNHCPYVIAVIDRLVADASVLMKEGFGFAAICSNDAAAYPDDSFDKMKAFAKAHDFAFPYLHDETQAVARAYGAVCTPDFFGFGPDRKLKYRGRLDEGRTQRPAEETRGGNWSKPCARSPRPVKFPRSKIPSMGCSIKWKAR